MEEPASFEEIALSWEADKRAYVKRSTMAIYGINLRTHLLPAFGQRTAIDESDVQAFVNHKIQNGLNIRTVKSLLMLLKMVLHYAQKHNGWNYPSLDIRFPTERERRAFPVLPLEQQKHLLEYLYSHPSARNLGIALCLNTGLRIGELCALRWEDIDLQVGVIHVSKTLQRIYVGKRATQLVLGTPKTANSFREIPLSDKIWAALKELGRCARPRDFLLSGSPQPAEPAVCRRHLARVLEALGMPAVRFHALRHTFATRCIESNCDYKTVSELLGHSNIGITLNLYVHPNLSQKKKCVEQMCQSLSGENSDLK